METNTVKILGIEKVTHDVKRFCVEKPKGYSFIPGQATEIAINKVGWTSQKRPFTFTGLNSQDFLEFTIKIYQDRKGVTRELGKLSIGDELIIHDVWGAIQYQGEGVFFAGGAGITPFIAIFRHLKKVDQVGGNQLFFSNKTDRDIILRDELGKILGENFHNTLTAERVDGLHYGMIDENFISGAVKDFSQQFYICGPDPMVQSISKILQKLGGAQTLVTVEI